MKKRDHTKNCQKNIFIEIRHFLYMGFLTIFCQLKMRTEFERKVLEKIRENFTFSHSLAPKILTPK